MNPLNFRITKSHDTLGTWLAYWTKSWIVFLAAMFVLGLVIMAARFIVGLF